MASIVDKIVGVLQDAVDYWTDQHPAQRLAPHRDWEYPQIAGYESHPYFPQIKEAFRKVPRSYTASDFTLRRAAAPRELKHIGNGVSGWIEHPSGRISIIPLSPEQVRFGTAHELGHNYLVNKYSVAGPGTEIPATKIALDALSGLPVRSNEIVDLLETVANPVNPAGVERFNRTLESVSRAVEDINVDPRKQKSVWK